MLIIKEKETMNLRESEGVTQEVLKERSIERIRGKKGRDK